MYQRVGHAVLPCLHKKEYLPPGTDPLASGARILASAPATNIHSV